MDEPRQYIDRVLAFAQMEAEMQSDAIKKASAK